jgi:hypothetical protein
MVQSGFLTAITLREFFEAWTSVVGLIERLKAGSAGGRLIQFPKIPPAVSESLACRSLIIRDVFPDAVSMVRGGAADISVLIPSGLRRIEVKGSGISEFQTFGRKDYACDLLVWLRFGQVFSLTAASQIQVALIPTPIDTMGQLGSRVTYRSAIAAAAVRGNEIESFELPVSALLECG